MAVREVRLESVESPLLPTRELEEFVRESRAREKIDRERAELFVALLRTDGWKAYESLLASLLESKGSELLRPAGSLDGCIQAEHVKGTMYGLLLAKDLPGVTIASMRVQVPEEDE